MGTLPRSALLLAVVAIAACGGSTTSMTTSPETPVLRIPVGSSPVDGPADAWVTIVEFSDFECPFCARVQPTLASVLPEFGADVRLVFKNFPLSMHAHARPAAVAAECAHRQGRFWEFHDLVFSGQSALFGAADFEGALAGVAAQAGLDVAAWQACRVDPTAEAAVIADMALCARWGIGSTPTFVVNGTPVVGNQPASVFRAAIEKARAAARASGTPAASYYDTVIVGP